MDYNQYSQDRFALQILDAYHRLESETERGYYGHVFSEWSHNRSWNFCNLIYKHIDYRYFYNDSMDETESLSGDETPWLDQKIKFAYY